MRQITYAGVLHTSPVERRSGTGKDKRTNVPPNVSSAGTESLEGETSLGIARKHSDGAPKAALRPEAKVSKFISPVPSHSGEASVRSLMIYSGSDASRLHRFRAMIVFPVALDFVHEAPDLGESLRGFLKSE